MNNDPRSGVEQTPLEAEPRSSEPRSIDVAALVLAIIAPLVGLIVSLVARSKARNEQRSLSRVASAALVVSVILTGLWVVGGVVGGVAAGLYFTGAFAVSQQISTELPPADQMASDIELRVDGPDGSAASEQDLAAVAEIIDYRLESVGMARNGLYRDGDRVHVTFDDSVDSAALDRAVEALTGEYRADFREVLQAGPCDPTTVSLDDAEDQQITVCTNDGAEGLLLGPSEMSGTTITKTEAAQITNSSGVAVGGWSITIDLDETGTTTFASITSRLYQAGQGNNRLAILLDGHVLSAPTINAEIAGGQVEISGAIDEAEAEDIARQLRLASLGLVLTVESTSSAR
jgi:hypothetical protein